jgi:malonyl-CoA O-methyltransferase
MLDKKRIRTSFSHAAPTYEANSEVQKQVAGELVHHFTHRVGAFLDAAMLPAFAANGDSSEQCIETVQGHALDIGCGTGSVGRTLSKVYPGLTVWGSDIADGMVQTARELSVVIGAREEANRILCAESEALPFASSSFDYCFSSLVYQWVDGTECAFAEAHRVLVPGGLFLFSTLGPETMTELRQSYSAATARLAPEAHNTTGAGRIAPYKEPALLREELKRAGFGEITVERKRIVKEYSNMYGLLKRLKRIGAFRRTEQPVGPDSGPPTLGTRATTIKEAARIYRERFGNPDGSINATYDVLYFSCVRSKPGE